MRVTTVLVIALLAAVLALYWSPLPAIPLGGNSVLILGGYPWHAPSAKARDTFVALGVALTVVAAILIALAIKFDKDLSEELD